MYAHETPGDVCVTFVTGELFGRVWVGSVLVLFLEAVIKHADQKQLRGESPGCNMQLLQEAC